VRTAPLSRNILPGITREILKTRLDVPFEEVEAGLATVKRASEVFMAGTTRDVTAVVKLDGQTIGDGRPGPVVRDLGRKLADLFDRECPA
jgi:D-alanine transaminase